MFSFKNFLAMRSQPMLRYSSDARGELVLELQTTNAPKPETRWQDANGFLNIPLLTTNYFYRFAMRDRKHRVQMSTFLVLLPSRMVVFCKFKSKRRLVRFLA
jgi:hypothetical protein